MRKIPAVKSVMTPFPYSVDIEQNLAFARSFLEEHALGHLPVRNDEQLLGIISMHDLNLHLAGNRNEQDSRVGDIEIRNHFIVDLNERLDNVLQAMADDRLDAVLVTRQGKLAGIFTVTDVCRSYATCLRDLFSPTDGDAVA